MGIIGKRVEKETAEKLIKESKELLIEKENYEAQLIKAFENKTLKSEKLIKEAKEILSKRKAKAAREAKKLVEKAS